MFAEEHLDGYKNLYIWISFLGSVSGIGSFYQRDGRQPSPELVVLFQ